MNEIESAYRTGITKVFKQIDPRPDWSLEFVSADRQVPTPQGEQARRDERARDGQHHEQGRDGNLATGQRWHVRERGEVAYPVQQIQQRADLAGQEGRDEHGPRDRGGTA